MVGFWEKEINRNAVANLWHSCCYLGRSQKFYLFTLVFTRTQSVDHFRVAVWTSWFVTIKLLALARRGQNMKFCPYLLSTSMFCLCLASARSFVITVLGLG